MKITFDIDGVLTHYPEILMPFVALLRASGHQVGLCTGRHHDALPWNWEQQFDFAITCDSPEEEMRLAGRVAHTDEEKMKYWKSAALKENEVDLHFDDWADVMDGPVVRIGQIKTPLDAGNENSNI